MNCRNVLARLDALMDGELDSREMMQVRSHLAECPNCQAEFGALQTLKSALRNLDSMQTPAELENWLVAKINEEVEAKRRMKTQRWSLAAGVATLVFVMGFAFSSSRQAEMANDLKAKELQRELQMDGVREMGSDPLAGGTMVVPANYGP